MSRRSAAKFLEVWRGRRLAVLLLTLAVPVALWLAGSALGDRLRFERAAVLAGEWWRILTGHLVHLDGAHLAMNLAALVLLWWLYLADARLRDWALVALGAALGVSAGLLVLAPAVGWYAGLSGLLHGVWAAAALACWKRWPLESVVTFALLAAKLVFEHAFGALSAGLGATLPVVTEAHLYGAAGGLASATALRLWRRSL